MMSLVAQSVRRTNDHPEKTKTEHSQYRCDTDRLVDMEPEQYGPYQPLKNESSFNSSIDYETYITAYDSFKKFELTIGIVMGVTTVLCGVIGVFSAVLTLLTFCGNKILKYRCFVYYKAIAIAEILYLASGRASILVETIYVQDVWSCPYQLSTLMVDAANNLCVFVDLLVIYLSIERAIACLLPLHFHLIDKKAVSYSVIAGAALLVGLLNVPYLFAYRIETDSSGKCSVAYNSVWSATAEAAYDSILESCSFADGILIMVSTSLAVAGMIRSIFTR